MDVKRIYAKREIKYQGKQYRPGDELPPVDVRRLADWQKADSVYVIGESDPPRTADAKAAAEPKGGGNAKPA